jgi:hypothetical protein
VQCGLKFFFFEFNLLCPLPHIGFLESFLSWTLRISFLYLDEVGHLLLFLRSSPLDSPRVASSRVFE